MALLDGCVVVATTLVAMVATGARVARACDTSTESVVAYAAGSDRYAVRVGGAVHEPQRLTIRRLSTGEPLDDIACVKGGRCELTDALGMRACYFTPVHASKVMHGLVLAPVPAEGGAAGRWGLSQESKSGVVRLLGLHASGELELRVVRIVGRRVLVVVRQTHGDSCAPTRERVIVLDEAELRPGRARLEQAHVDVDVDAETTELSTPPRPAPPFRPMPARTVANAARSAIAAGMERLAACWIQHNAAAMSSRARLALHRRLADDPSLASLAELAREPGGTPPRPATRRASVVQLR